METQIEKFVPQSRRGRVAAAVALMSTSLMVKAGGAFAAASTTTGLDYGEMGSDVLTEAKPAIVAGVGILVLLTAVKVGKKAWNKVT